MRQKGQVTRARPSLCGDVMKQYQLKREQLLRFIAGGASVAAACRGAGVARSSFYRWRDEHHFREQLTHAEALREVELLEGLKTAAQARRDWRAYAWLLATLAPQEWGHQCRCRVHGHRGRRRGR